MPQSQPDSLFGVSQLTHILITIIRRGGLDVVNRLRFIINSAVRNVGMRSISISVYSTIFSSIGCSFKLFEEIKIVLPHMDIMKLSNDLAMVQWYV